MTDIPSASTVAPPQTSTSSSEPAASQKLTGHLGVPGLVFSVLAFNAPIAIMAGFVPLVIGYGNGLGAPLTFIVIGALLITFSVGLTTMSIYMKNPGAFYSYIAAGIGRVAGLGGAFVAFTAYITIAGGVYAYSGILVDALVHGVLGGPSVPWWAWALGMWVIASTLSLLQIDLSAKVLGVAMCAEIVMVLIWQAAVAIKGGPEGYAGSSFTVSSFGSGSLGFGLLFGILCVTGFEAVAVFREETRDPVKTVPRATYAAVGVLAVLYTAGAWAYIVAYGPSKAVDAANADPSGSFATSVGKYVGQAAVDIVSVLLVTSIFAALLATQNIASRYLYALGHDGVLSTKLAKVHPRHGSPYIAAAAVAAIALAFIVIAAIAGLDPVKAYAGLCGFGGFCLLVLMTTTSIAVLMFFRRTHHSSSIAKTIVAPVVSFIGLVIILFLAGQNMDLVIGGSKTAGYIALGLVVAIAAAGAGLALRYRARKPTVYDRIGQQSV